jgi:crossover junction endodeoxyribonuclease RusA
MTGQGPAATDTRLTFWVPGQPAAQGSKRHVGKGHLVEQSKAVGPWRERVAWTARQHYRGSLLQGPIAVRLAFVMHRPTSTPKRSTPPAVKRPDLDKMIRAVFDALTSVVWGDDSQAVEVFASKRLAEVGESPGVRIEVQAATAEERAA